MKIIMKKTLFLFFVLIFTCMFFVNKAYAVMFLLELSGDGIQNDNGIYLCTKKIPVGGTLSVKAEFVTSNDMYIEGVLGEEQRSDVTADAQWSSSKENVATVDKGVITGIAEGVTEITVTYRDYTEKFDVTVGEDVEAGENITIVQKDNIKTILEGKTLQLDIQGVETLSDIKNKDVKWSSSDEQVAKVDSNGLVTATGAGKVTIKAEYFTEKKTYESTYEINVQKDNTESPMENVDDIYNLFLDKKEMTINVGESSTVEITAKLKEGLMLIDEYKEETDNWDVEWKIKDETIAKCVPKKGIVNNIYGATQVVGRATIQGLKVGTTELLIKVKVSADQVEEFKIPITVNKIKKDDDKKEDNTAEDKGLPKTGENNLMIKIVLGITVIDLAYLGIKLKNKF